MAVTYNDSGTEYNASDTEYSGIVAIALLGFRFLMGVGM